MSSFKKILEFHYSAENMSCMPPLPSLYQIKGFLFFLSLALVFLMAKKGVKKGQKINNKSIMKGVA